LDYLTSSYNKLYLCHEHKEKKRCPHCQSLDTKKKGYSASRFRTKRGIIKRRLQRYFCKNCKKSFTHNQPHNRTRYSETIKYNAVKDYVITKNSLSEVSARYQITPPTILNWLKEQSSYFPSILSLHSKLPKSGVIQIDGKEIKVSGNRKVILIASDAVSKKPFYYTLSNKENKEASKHFLKGVKRVYGAPIKGIVSDFGKGKCFVGVVNSVLPDASHQICIVHFLRYIWLFLPRTRRSEYYWRNTVLKWIIRKVITAKDKNESLYWLKLFIRWIPFFRASYHKRFIRSLLTNYTYLTRHYDDSFLLTNTNRLENLNRQLNRKLKNLDGFKSVKNIKPFLRIWFANYINNKQIKTQLI